MTRKGDNQPRLGRKPKKVPSLSGGQANVRGVLVQTLIALLDAVLGDSSFEWATLEPNLPSEKFDLLWKDGKGTHAVQVKTSVNPFSRRVVEDLTREMKAKAEGEVSGAECRLVLVGHPDKDLARIEELHGVEIDVRSQTEDALIDQAAHRLHKFLDREKLGPVTAWFHELIVGELATHLQRKSTAGQRVNRADIAAMLKGWIEQSPTYEQSRRDIRELNLYLQKLAEDCQYVTLLGIDPQAGDVTDATTPELAKVYIQLTATNTRQGTGAGSAVEAMFSGNRSVILGGPGSGKSTLFRYLTFCLAKKHLEPKDDLLKEFPGGAWKSMPPVPVWVELRRLVAACEGQPGTRGDSVHIWEYLEKGMKNKNLESAIPALRASLEYGHALVLLDGLDEVPESFRTFVRQAIESFATGGFRRSRIVVTCRIKSYLPRGLRLQGFTDYNLAEFTPEQSRQFVRLWYEECSNKKRMTAEDAAQCIPSLVKALSNENLAEMARNPMHLTAMACLHTAGAGQPLPEESAKLFDLMVNTLLFLWAKSKMKGATAQDETQDELGTLLKEADCTEKKLRSALERLAFQTHKGRMGTRAEVKISANISDEALKLVRILAFSSGVVPHGYEGEGVAVVERN